MTFDPTSSAPSSHQHPDDDLAGDEPAPLPSQADVSAVFARMSGLLLSQQTTETVLRLITALIVETVPGAGHAGVTLIEPMGKRSAAATDETAGQADALQYELEEGPCLAAWASRVPQRVDDTATDQRWPRWGGAVQHLGLRSAMSAPLIVGDQSLGAIKAYADEPDAFDAYAERVLVLCATQSAILVANIQSYESARRTSEQLKEALHSRDVIGQAKGILIATRHVDEEEAFALLAATSQRQNRKLHVVAREVVAAAVKRRR